MFSSYKRVFWLSVVMALFVYVPFGSVAFSTDVWTRFARISEWAASGFPLKEQLLMSQNYPFGFEMHWTRPLDYIGYAFAWPFIDTCVLVCPSVSKKKKIIIFFFFLVLL